MTMPDDNELERLTAEITRLVKAVYDGGFSAGGLAMRDNILQAASAPMAMRPGAVSMAIQVTEQPDTAKGAADVGKGVPVVRAPKGLVPATIREALLAAPGSTVSQLVDLAFFIEPRVAAASIGNELRRFDGKLYERDGNRWWLLGQKESAGESGKTAPADQFTFEPEGR